MLGLREETVEFAAGGIEGALLEQSHIVDVVLDGSFQTECRQVKEEGYEVLHKWPIDRKIVLFAHPTLRPLR